MRYAAIPQGCSRQTWGNHRAAWYRGGFGGQQLTHHPERAGNARLERIRLSFGAKGGILQNGAHDLANIPTAMN